MMSLLLPVLHSATGRGLVAVDTSSMRLWHSLQRRILPGSTLVPEQENGVSTSCSSLRCCSLSTLGVGQAKARLWLPTLEPCTRPRSDLYGRQRRGPKSTLSYVAFKEVRNAFVLLQQQNRRVVFCSTPLHHPILHFLTTTIP